MTAVLALLSALLVGGADFVGGVTSRRASPVRVAAGAQLAGLLLAVALAALWGAARVTVADAGWSLASGVVVGIGLALFYAAMGRGLISVVAPVAAMTGASVPVVFSLVRGERPGTVALAGIVAAVIAIGIVSAAPGGGGGSGALGLALGAGALFGLFFVFLSLAHEDAGLWPVALSRVGSAGALVVLALVLTRGIDPGRTVLPAVLIVAVLEVIAAATLLLALQRGPVSVASVLASLYPVSTTVLAAGVLHERLRPTQLAGVGLALVAVVLIALG
jgi:drug/metabolite transporter (DMT)-like permease